MRISDWSSDVCSSDLVCRFKAERFAARRHSRGHKDRFGDPAMMGERAFERDIATRHQTLRNGEGMDGFGPIALSQQVGAALHAEQGTILERPIDQAVAPGVSAAQQIAELADRKSTRLNSSH